MGRVYRMDEGVKTWSREKRAFTNWHTVCGSAFVKNGTLHFDGTQDGHCGETANNNLLTEMSAA
jgi:hypothetical protein